MKNRMKDTVCGTEQARLPRLPRARSRYDCTCDKLAALMQLYLFGLAALPLGISSHDNSGVFVRQSMLQTLLACIHGTLHLDV